MPKEAWKTETEDRMVASCARLDLLGLKCLKQTKIGKNKCGAEHMNFGNKRASLKGVTRNSGTALQQISRRLTMWMQLAC